MSHHINPPPPPHPEPWDYEAPRTAEVHADMHYYRASEWSLNIKRPHGSSVLPRVDLRLLRFGTQKEAQLSLSVGGVAEISAQLDQPGLLALRNALNDALHDITLIAQAESHEVAA